MTDERVEDRALPRPDSRPRDRFLILFDGVCNLCSSAVQWVIARDARPRFEFASLQSEAARSELGKVMSRNQIAALPDSILLVDDQGVHVRSTAAIRIARELGFPYTLLAAALLIPRPVRDAMYGFVARNRYRWFGRQDTCMIPTPDLQARFLDAHEPRLPVEPRGPEAQRGPSDRSWIAAWLIRCAIVYLIVYVMPWGRLVNPLVTWVGQTAFGVQADFEPTGSGDRTFNYVKLVVDLALALIGATAWTIGARGAKVSVRSLDASRLIARYYLGMTMLTYGWVKVFPLQFPAPGPDRLIQSYGDSSPMGLAWTFLGASVGYQVFAGLAELLGGYLLFWRRTTLLGALVCAAVLTNVMAINYFYDVPVKLFSTHLLLIAVFLLAPDLPRLVGLLGFNLPVSPRIDVPFWQPKGWKRTGMVLVHLLFVAGITVPQVRANLDASRERGVLAKPSPLAGVYRVESFIQGGRVDRANEDTDRWVRVGLNPPFAVTIQRANGESERMRLSLDAEARTASFFDRGGQAPEEPMFALTQPEPGVIRLDGTFEGRPTVLTLRRSEVEALLLERGFRWVNEFPFNQ